MVVRLANNWWIVAARSVAAIVFGTIALVWPMRTLYVLILSFAAFAFVDGIFALVTVLMGRGRKVVPWWSLLLEGVLGILAGIVSALNPNGAEEVLVYLFAGWAIVTGVFELATAFRLRKDVTGEWALAVAGLLSIGFGAIIAFRPMIGAVYLARLIGLYALVFGVMMLSLSLRLRRFSTHHHRDPAAPNPH